MKGLFVVAKNKIDILEFPEPTIGEFEALVQVQACAICNSTDWKLIEGEFFSGAFPMLLGHESIGKVIPVGEKVTSFKLGDRVLRTTLRDDQVPFPGGRSCWGGFVEQAIVTDVWAQKGAPYNSFPHPQQILPVNIPPEHAVALITLKETLSCLENTEVLPGQSLAIVGTGPVAQALTFFANLSGIAPVVVIGRRSEHAEVFTRLGADAYVAGELAPAFVKKILAGGGFDRVIEAVGARAALSLALKLAAANGKVNLYGIAPESEPYLAKEEQDERVFRGKVAEAEAHDRLLAWVREGKIHLADWVSDVLPWQEYAQGFEMVKQKKANKVVLKF